ncbi:hypothetical protein MOBT1_003374 [Malassezia obtusa]|uniref:ENTH domain-containing protein n=1 Tax=Malassezia obtusa TaxID=76774 RepID=A0AAF0E428_9BASI|nr:hypothetical protein MOBT1_003374 [Malassezia obtusa]
MGYTLRPGSTQVRHRWDAAYRPYDKLVKGATKPKQDLPKPKYIDPILASAYGKDGGLQDVFRSLSYRLQDPNSTVRDPAHRQVVFKTLIVVHTLMRSDASVTVLSYLAGDPSALRLKRVAMGGLLEYTYSRTLTRYATYLEYRITTFKELGYDLVQASKRDRFARLRKMSVSKGLLREIAMLQRLMNALLECSFFADNKQDDLTMSALRMTLKDLLAHYMGINEGIINMLEHYFDMGRREAERSLELYKQFCWQTEKVVAFLDSSRRLSHSLRSAVPSLNHAPLSLAGALEEYLRDPNFEKNRTSYLQNRGKNGSSSAPKDGAAKSTTSAPSERPSDKHATDSRATESDAKNTSNASKEAPKTQNTNQQALQDFFEALEQPSTSGAANHSSAGKHFDV